MRFWIAFKEVIWLKEMFNDTSAFNSWIISIFSILLFERFSLESYGVTAKKLIFEILEFISDKFITDGTSYTLLSKGEFLMYKNLMCEYLVTDRVSFNTQSSSCKYFKCSAFYYEENSNVEPLLMIKYSLYYSCLDDSSLRLYIIWCENYFIFCIRNYLCTIHLCWLFVLQ